MDYYETLGLNRDASESAIKKAYRELSFKTHPDRNSSPDAAIKMQQINEAYETLKDPQKKRQYDMGPQNPLENIFGDIFRRDPFMRQMNPHIQIFEMMHQMGGEPMIFNFEDMHQSIPGHPGHQGHSTQVAPPLETTVELTFEQAYNGHSMPVTITRTIAHGLSRTKETEKIYVTIPPGIDTGEIIELPEKGNQQQQNKGPLKIHIKVKPHEVFERKGLHLYCLRNLSFKESICGFDFTLTLLDGTTLKLKSSPGHIIQNMDEKVIKGKGIHRENGGGDLILKFKVLSPQILSEEQVALFANLL
jgi:DnaJ-class molecular chaperone